MFLSFSFFLSLFISGPQVGVREGGDVPGGDGGRGRGGERCLHCGRPTGQCPDSGLHQWGPRGGTQVGCLYTGGEDTGWSTSQHFDRLVEFGDLGIDLPPLPYDLHPKAGQRKFPAAKKEGEDEEEENVVDTQSHPAQIQPFGTYNKEIEAVVIEAEPEQSDRLAVGALAGPPLPRQSEIDTNIYHYNTNYNLVKFDRIVNN